MRFRPFLLSLVILSLHGTVGAAPEITEEVAPSHPVHLRTSLFSPSEISLRRGSEAIKLRSPNGSAIGVHVGISRQIEEWNRIAVHTEFTAGFRFLQGIADKNTNDGLRTGYVTQYWIPLQVGVRGNYQIRGFRFLEPVLGAGVGLNAIVQGANASGMKTSRFIPFVSGYAGVNFVFSQDSDDWFRSFSFGTNYQTSVAVPDAVRGWDIQLNFQFFI